MFARSTSPQGHGAHTGPLGLGSPFGDCGSLGPMGSPRIPSWPLQGRMVGEVLIPSTPPRLRPVVASGAHGLSVGDPVAAASAIKDPLGIVTRISRHWVP